MGEAADDLLLVYGASKHKVAETELVFMRASSRNKDKVT